MRRVLLLILLLLVALPAHSQGRTVVLDRVGGTVVAGNLPSPWEPMDPEQVRSIAARLLQAKVLGEGYVYEEEIAAWEAVGSPGSPVILAFSSRGGPVAGEEIGRITSWLDGSNLLTQGDDGRPIPFRISRIDYDQKRRVITSKYFFHFQRQRYVVVSSILFTGYGFCNLMYVGLTGGPSGTLENDFTALVDSVRLPRSLRYPEHKLLGFSPTFWTRTVEVGLGVLFIAGAYALLMGVGAGRGRGARLKKERGEG